MEQLDRGVRNRHTMCGSYSARTGQAKSSPYATNGVRNGCNGIRLRSLWASHIHPMAKLGSRLSNGGGTNSSTLTPRNTHVRLARSLDRLDRRNPGSPLFSAAPLGLHSTRRLGRHHVFDFDRPENNDWVAVNQFTVVEGQNTRRPDILIFVNGLPVALLETTAWKHELGR